MGRLSPTKGVLQLPSIMSHVVKNSRKAKLAIVGFGEIETIVKIEASINDLGLNDSIKVIGGVSDREKFAMLKTAKVLVFPSFEEGFGLIILEALACDCSIVCWDLESYAFNFPNLLRTAPIGDNAKMAELIIDELDKTEDFHNSEIDKFVSERSFDVMTAEMVQSVETLL